MATKRYRNGKFSHYEDVVYHETGERNATGRLVYRKQWVRGRTLKDLAKNKQAAIDERDSDDIPVDPDDIDMTVAELYTLVKERHVKRLRPKSQAVWHAASVRRLARVVTLPVGKNQTIRSSLFDIKLKDLTTEMIDAWMSELAAETRTVIKNGERTNERIHGDRSINLARGCLVTTLNKGKRWHKVGERNVAEYSDRFREDTRLARVYTPHEIFEIGVGVYRRHMDHVGERGYRRATVLEYRAARDMCILVMLAFGGMRISEAFVLRNKDHLGHVFQVEHSLDWKAKGYLGPVKTGKARTVPMLPEVELAWERLRELSRHNEPDDFLFSNDAHGRRRHLDRSVMATSMPLDLATWRSKVFNIGAGIAGFPEARPHFMRHTFISLMRRHGFSSSEVAQFVGDTEEVVNRVYTQSYNHDLTERIAKASADFWR